MRTRVLLAEPDRSASESLKSALEGSGYAVTPVRSGKEVFEEASHSNFDFFVLDSKVLGDEEASLMHFLRARSPAAQLILTTDPANAERALRAAQQSTAISFLKPVRPEDLLVVLNRFQSEFRGADELPDVNEKTPFLFHDLVGKSALMRRVLRLVAKVASSDAAVILSGETGTGKELIARVVHRLSPRADKPFVTVNCGSIPDRLLESELFGHKRGAFTDAIADKKGLFEVANGGTLLLDEVGELPLEAQVKLLRAIEELEIRRVGDTTPVRVNVRVVAATNRELLEEVREGRFREDLYFRLNVVQIHLPPLRDRREDIPALLQYFLNEANRKFRRGIVSVSPEVVAVLANYRFPGNVRELRNLVEHAVVMADRETLRVQDLPVPVVAAAQSSRLLEQSRDPGSAAAPAGTEFKFRTIAEAERDLIAETLRNLEGNQTEAARKLGISRSTLWRKIKEYGISV